MSLYLKIVIIVLCGDFKNYESCEGLRVLTPRVGRPIRFLPGGAAKAIAGGSELKGFNDTPTHRTTSDFNLFSYIMALYVFHGRWHKHLLSDISI